MSEESSQDRKPSVAELPGELADVIDQLPLLEMIDSVHTGIWGDPLENDDVALMGRQVRILLERLNVHAILGNERAARILREAGNSAAEKLAALGPEKDPEDYTTMPVISNGKPMSVVKLRGDFSAVNELLAARMEEYVLRYPKIENREDAPTSIPLLSGALVVDVVDSLFWRDDLATRTRAALLTAGKDSETEDFTFAYPHLRLARIFRVAKSIGLATDDEFQSINAEASLHNAIRIRVEERLLQLAREASLSTVEKLASLSLTWPIPLSAIVDKRRAEESTRDALGIGSALPFRLEKIKKAGRLREFGQGDHTAFALQYCLKLYRERESRAPLTRQDRKDAEAELKRLSAEKPEQNIAGIIDDDYIIECMRVVANRENRWRLAAIMLPEFPPVEDTPQSRSDFKQWHEAALLLAAKECAGDWENYSRWPEWVMTRSREKSRTRSKREAVGDCLKRGMKNLRRQVSM